MIIRKILKIPASDHIDKVDAFGKYIYVPPVQNTKYIFENSRQKPYLSDTEQTRGNKNYTSAFNPASSAF